jgi:hypothetical protein
MRVIAIARKSDRRVAWNTLRANLNACSYCSRVNDTIVVPLDDVETKHQAQSKSVQLFLYH